MAIAGVLFLFCLLIGFVVIGVRLADLVRKLGVLEDEARTMRSALARLETDIARLTFGKGAAGEVRTAPERPIVPVLPVAPEVTAPSVQAQGNAAPPTAVPQVLERLPWSAPASVTPPSRSREEWEAMIGGKLLNRIGAVALILGVGFFLKYAFDNNWISETVRVLIGALMGGLCLGAAERAKGKGFLIFSQGLVGAGIAILYLAVFAAFNFYTLVSQPVAYLLMSAVTVIAALHAFRYDSHVVAVLALFGGFLTPYLLWTETVSLRGLFTYVLLLDAGVLAIALRKPGWIWLEPLALVGTYVVFFTWFDSSRPDPGLWAMLGFVAGFGILFHGTDLLRIAKGFLEAFDLRRVTAIAHSILLFAALMSVLQPESDEARAMGAATLAALFGASAWYAGRDAARGRFLFGEFMVTAIILLLIAVGIQFDDFALLTLWALLCGGIAWAGLRQGRASVWVPAVAFLPLVFLVLLFTPGAVVYAPAESFRPVWNERALAIASLAISVGLVGVLFRKYAVNQSRHAGEAFGYGWMAVALFGLSVETLDLFVLWMTGVSEATRAHLAFQRVLALSVVWQLFALPLATRGLRLRDRPLFFGPLWIILAAALLASLRALWYVPIEEFSFLANPRVAALLITAASVLLLTRLLAKHRTVFPWVGDFLDPARVLAILVFLILVSTETWDYFRHQIASTAPPGITPSSEGRIEELRNLQQLALSGVWLLFSLLLMGIGLWKRNRSVRVQSIVIFGAAIIKIFVYDLSFLETLYRIFSFVGLGLILLMVSYLYQRYRHVILGPPSNPAP